MNALEIHGVDTYYGTSHVLHGLSLMVTEGGIVAFWGGMEPERPQPFGPLWG
jgi:ABC-type branched-subunit amino acid transport system ATPase component